MKNKIPLVSSEITGLWKSYMSDTMIEFVLKYYLNNVEDNETRAILQQTCDLSRQHIQESTNLFNVENMAMADTLRSDLQTKYMKYIAEDMKYIKDGADIMIANGWLEQLPQAIKYEKLVGV